MMKRIEAMTLSILLWTSILTAAFWSGARAESSANDTTVQAEVKALFLNVGKADAALFTLGAKQYLIDTGTPESADALLRALQANHVQKLDGVIITHIDNDHVGGLKSLLKSDITVSQLYAATFNNAKSIDKHPVEKQSVKYGIPLQWLNRGDVIEVSGSIRFVTLGPMTLDPENENNNSLVFRLETPQGDMMLTGDMETDEEAELLSAGLIRNAAVLKVGHHGAKDASSAAFIYTVKPQIAIIPTDSDVEPNTPDPDVIARLWNVGAEVFVTQKAACGVEVTLRDGNAVGRLVGYTVQ